MLPSHLKKQAMALGYVECVSEIQKQSQDREISWDALGTSLKHRDVQNALYGAGAGALAGWLFNPAKKRWFSALAGAALGGLAGNVYSKVTPQIADFAIKDLHEGKETNASLKKSAFSLPKLEDIPAEYYGALAGAGLGGSLGYWQGGLRNAALGAVLGGGVGYGSVSAGRTLGTRAWNAIRQEVAAASREAGAQAVQGAAEQLSSSSPQIGHAVRDIVASGIQPATAALDRLPATVATALQPVETLVGRLPDTANRIVQPARDLLTSIPETVEQSVRPIDALADRLPDLARQGLIPVSDLLDTLPARADSALLQMTLSNVLKEYLDSLAASAANSARRGFGGLPPK